MTEPKTESGTREEKAPQAMKCDFCGDEVASVRRVALDGQYDRLRKAHEVLYACSSCSERKERQRLGFER